MANKQYNIVIIGGGPGGYTAAVRAAELGASVALVEKRKLGGVCLHEGCIPTKSLCHYAYSDASFENAFRGKKNAVDILENQVETLVSKNKIRIYRGTAYVKSLNNITIDGRESISAAKLIIATGSKPIIPASLDIERKRIMTSDEIVDMERLPKSILIIGGGYIGCEFASIFSSYGVEVHIVESANEILLTEDEDVKNEVLKSFMQKKISVYAGTQASRLKIIQNAVAAELSNGRTIKTELVLVAIGRVPNTGDIGIKEIGIELTPKGGIKVNERMQTNISGVYAIGDVVDAPLRLAHVAEGEGIVAVENALANAVKNPRISDYVHVPRAIFTKPEIGSVGKTEAQLKEQKIDFAVGKWLFKWNGKAQAEGDTEGFAKIISDKSGKILGASIVGRNASEIIERIADAMISQSQSGDNLGILKNLSSPFYSFHPSRCEAIKGSAEEVLKKIGKN